MQRTLAVVALAIALAIAAAAAPAAGQAARPMQSNTSGILLGIGLDATTVRADDPDIASGTKSGGGIFLQLGYGFTPHFTLYSELTGAGLNDDGDGSYPSSAAGVGHFDLGARYHFGGPGSRVRPFLQAAIGVRVVTHDNVPYLDRNGDTQVDVLRYSGGTATLGAGLQYFFRQTLALHASAQVSGGRFTTVSIGDISENNQDVPSTSGRVNVGLNWFPSRPR